MMLQIHSTIQIRQHGYHSVLAIGVGRHYYSILEYRNTVYILFHSLILPISSSYFVSLSSVLRLLLIYLHLRLF